jgi:hypothetical protein
MAREAGLIGAIAIGALAFGGIMTPVGAQGPGARLGVTREQPRLAAGERIELKSLPAGRSDQRWLGAALGGAGLALAGGLEGAAYCGNSEHGPRNCTGTTLGFAAAGGAIGGLIGYFIGRAIAR